MSRPSTTRYAVLGMLTHGPMTGYRLREEITGSVGHFWRESYGQLYPAIAALLDEGLVCRAAGSGRSQPLELTAAGRAELRRWLATEPRSLASDRDELLLRVFFGRQAEPGVLRGHLQRHRDRLEELAGTYAGIEQLVSAQDSPDRPYWLLTVRHGTEMVAAGLRWNAEAVALLDAEGAA